MSGVLKGVKKVFKKVVKTVKKVAPLALAAAAIYFTGGAALGLAGTAGGFGGAAASAASGLGLTGTAATAFTGALTQAGYGAAIGAATSAVTGGSISKGAAVGALGGAVTGGVMGGLGAPTDPLAGIGGGGEPAAVNELGGAAESVSAAMRNAGATGAAPGLGAPYGPPAAAPAATPAAGAAGGAESGFSKFFGTEAGAKLIAGAGEGLIRGLAADDDSKALIKRDELKYDTIRSNYRQPSQGLATPTPGAGSGPAIGLQAPGQAFDPGNYDYEYRFDPNTNQVLKVPRAMRST